MTFTPIDVVLRVAQATLGASEVPANTNAGPFVARCLQTTGLPVGHPWCAAWTTMIGTTALGAEWPVLASASVQQQVDWAAKRQVRRVATETPAQPGDLFALYYPALKRWAHIGFVWTVAADGTTVTTLEGNTSGTGSREGWLVASKTRTLTKQDRLIRWPLLLTSSASRDT
jgi:hypothetical protein